MSIHQPASVDSHRHQSGFAGHVGVCLMALSVLALSACGAKVDTAKSSQVLVSVNGEEITATQLNEELQRSGVVIAPAQQQNASKQLLDSLVERQLIVNAAVENRIDRDPEVVRAIERTKALVIAQAYMQKKLGTDFKPTSAEVGDYYAANPQFFAERKQLEMRQLVLADAITPELKVAIESAKTLDELAAYLEAHQISFGRNTITRTTSDFPKEMSIKLMSMPKGQLFLVREGPRSVLSVIVDVRDAPVSREVAAPQIEHFLATSKSKTAMAAEVARLRAAAKIEYLNRTNETPKPVPAALPVSSPAEESNAIARGVAGMK